MKDLFVRDLYNGSVSEEEIIGLYGWVGSKRVFAKTAFVDIFDSTGSIQAIIDIKDTDNYNIAKKIPLESAVNVMGRIHTNNTDKIEIIVTSIEVVSVAKKQISPKLRDDIDIFSESLANQLLSKRHLYIRNPKVMALLRFRSAILSATRSWFESNEFLEITAPILTTLPLYHDVTALPLEIHNEQVFLTQCVGFYLESAVHAFERVYNIGPSFRGEESRSKRHLMEYWHIKAEFAWGDLNDVMAVVENLISFLTSYSLDNLTNLSEEFDFTICKDGLKVPFPRISYRDAIFQLQNQGVDISFGNGLGSDEEAILSKSFDSPFWVVGIPRNIEPFPYKIDLEDDKVTMTADLIASNGFGELLGVAEKIVSLPELEERMTEKGKADDLRYRWVKELREFGCVSPVGFGMGVERLIRWMIGVPHVRDVIPFPRTFRRKIWP